jgi:hypothetical protein
VLTQFSGVLPVPAAVAGITGAEQSFAITGIVSGAPILGLSVAAGAGYGSALGGQLPPGLIVGGVRASGAGVLAVNLINVTAASITPPALQAVALHAPSDSSGAALAAAGSYVSYPMDVQSVQLAETLNALQRALRLLGVVAGS